MASRGRAQRRDFDLKFESGVSHAYHDSVQDIPDRYVRGHHTHYQTELGLHVRREYLLLRGIRREGPAPPARVAG